MEQLKRQSTELLKIVENSFSFSFSMLFVLTQKFPCSFKKYTQTTIIYLPLLKCIYLSASRILMGQNHTVRADIKILPYNNQ